VAKTMNNAIATFTEVFDMESSTNPTRTPREVHVGALGRRHH
jgi:hypothetical protein